MVQIRRWAALIILFACSYNALGFYDPTLGRWISRDPIGERGGLNLYEFVYNNPNSWVDSNGLDGISGPGSGNPGNVTPVLELQAQAEGYPSVEAMLQAQAQRKAAEEAAKKAAQELAKRCKRLSKGEIKSLQERGIDPHDLKPNSKFDLFKDPNNGNIYVLPKNGRGFPNPTGINIKGP